MLMACDHGGFGDTMAHRHPFHAVREAKDRPLSASPISINRIL